MGMVSVAVMKDLVLLKRSPFLVLDPVQTAAGESAPLEKLGQTYLSLIQRPIKWQSAPTWDPATERQGNVLVSQDSEELHVRRWSAQAGTTALGMGGAFLTDNLQKHQMQCHSQDPCLNTLVIRQRKPGIKTELLVAFVIQVGLSDLVPEKHRSQSGLVRIAL